MDIHAHAYIIKAIDTFGPFGRRNVNDAKALEGWEYMGAVRTGFLRKTHLFRANIGPVVGEA